MIALGLALSAVVLAGLAPRLMTGLTVLRRAPRAALALWQAVNVAAVLCALLAAPAAIPYAADAALPQRLILGLAICVSGSVLARLLLSAHRVGRHLRQLRRRHRHLVDVLAHVGHDDDLRVLEQSTPTAYCLPGAGGRQRVVISRGALDSLSRKQLRAVLAHERAHLVQRHDLLLEFFTVLHESVPAPVRYRPALAEVSLLVEALADRAAVRKVGALATARALLAVAQGGVPEAGLGASPASSASLRIRLLAEGPGPAALTAALYGLAGLCLAAPLTAFVSAWV